ncbi:MAG: ADP-ribose-binding protein [Aquificaceae bacterium]
MQVEVLKGSLLEIKADTIVNPANSYGLMGGGVAGVIKRFGGEEIEKEAIKKAPIPVGSAVLTTAGKLAFKGVIHVPTMEEPAMRTTEEKVRKAVRAALELADRMGFEVIAMPGMGTGVGGLSKEIAGKAMLEEIKAFTGKSLKKVVLVDIDHEMVEAWRKNL